jgi:glycosyltransferase involved in cell wall biosynthesis
MKSTINRATRQLGRRSRQLLRLLHGKQVPGFTDRLRRVTAEWLAPRGVVSLVRDADLMAVDLARPFQPTIPAIVPGHLLVANWVMTPPAPGSGGHTTVFRIIRYLEDHGYTNRVYFYDVYQGDHAYYHSIVRDYYGFSGPVRNVDHGMEHAHIVVATGWPTAYPIFNSRCAGKRFYFVQDFEPLFYPAGCISSHAENTYRMGFHGISIGRCFVQKLIVEYGMTVDAFDFGCDTAQYRRSSTSPRSGIVFYARRDNARRGVDLGLLTLQVFAARRPDIVIHIYGDEIGPMPFRFIDHGRITPDQINFIYNTCFAGLSLSFTNVSLVPLEMLAAGCIPVVNDSVYVRTDLDNPFVRFSPALPQALAAQLQEIIETPDRDALSFAAAASVQSATWDDAGIAFDKALRRGLEESICKGHNQQPASDAARVCSEDEVVAS